MSKVKHYNIGKLTESIRKDTSKLTETKNKIPEDIFDLAFEVWFCP